VHWTGRHSFSSRGNPIKETIYSAWLPQASTRRQRSRAGYSTGHWEGDTLVVDTVAMRDNTFIERGFTPHSEAITVHERIRPIADNMFEDKLTVTDPKALARAWDVTYIFFKLKPGQDEVREAVCAEGMADAK
jgi:hypothetical protein